MSIDEQQRTSELDPVARNEKIRSALESMARIDNERGEYLRRAERAEVEVDTLRAETKQNAEHIGALTQRVADLENLLGDREKELAFYRSRAEGACAALAGVHLITESARALHGVPVPREQTGSPAKPATVEQFGRRGATRQS